MENGLKVWDHFVATYAPNVTIPTNEDLVAFMAYRVGKPIPGDPKSAVVKLTTFTNTELNLLIHGLRAGFGGGPTAGKSDEMIPEGSMCLSFLQSCVAVELLVGTEEFL